MTHPPRHRHQSRISEFNRTMTIIENIAPSGDTITERTDTDTYLRIAYQNVRGVKPRDQIHSELEAMQDLGIDIMGMSETNCPWTAKSRASYDLLMREVFRSSHTIYTSAPTPTTGTYQPGGNLLTINGRTTGRIAMSGTDSWGRFCWYRLRGRRDEGILIICAYRVCHSHSHNPGPLTVYQQQYTLMRESGIIKPNPRKQLLTDLAMLIRTHRNEGYRPILMIDANGDYLASRRPDSDLARFLIDTGMVDPFHERFGIQPRTTINGTKRIDYIFTDPRCTQAIVRLGYLGTHEGAYSDHCMAYMDIDERQLFQGAINRPIPYHSREILLAQDDKVAAFTHALEEKYKDHKVHRKTFALADAFAQQGATEANISRYHSIYKEFLDMARAVSNRVGRKKYGYARSSALTIKGRVLLTVKQMLDCATRNAPFTPVILRRCEALNMVADNYAVMTVTQLRQEVRRQRRELWDIQKHCEQHRTEWLTSIAKDRARATDTPNWERKLKQMIQTTKENAVNRKLSMITKGPRGVLDRIQIPTHDWFYSPKYDELYHYDDGVFEAYPSDGTSAFFLHHTLKVLAPDAELVIVSKSETLSRWIITDILPRPKTYWTDITSQDEIEAHLLRRNKRHLEQTSREHGISTGPLLTDIRAHHGINPLTADILEGTFDTTYELSPELTEFFAALKQTPKELALRPIIGTITSEQFQRMFKNAREKTSSDSRTLNYSIWKCIARSDFISSFAAILLSLPFTYGFVNSHWTHMSDFMLEKKPGVRHIHTLRIIGKVAAEFNTCLKFFIGHQTMHNFEDSDPCDFQHGFRPNRSSVDAAMLKLLTFECARMHRSTVGMVQHDMAAHFDRMYPAMTNIYAQKYNVDHGILHSIGRTIDSLQRNVETAMGISKGTYQQEEDAPHLGGMVQGKADVPQWSTQQSDVLLRAHQRLTSGLQLHNPTGTKSIKHHSISFADDTDQHTNEYTAKEDCVKRVVNKLEHSAQTWNNLINIPGGLLAYHKCNWQLIAWKSSAGHMEMIHHTDQVLRIRDGKGAVAMIDFVPPTHPNIGLGYHLCPDGNQHPQFKVTMEALCKICTNATNSSLSESETRQLLRQRVLPKLTYVLHATSFTSKQCARLDSVIRSYILPRLRINRHFPAAVLYGPIKYGGMGFPHIHTLQTETQVRYLLKQLRWNKIVANDILVTIDSIQLHSGLQHPIMEHTHTPISYIGNSFFLSLRNRLAGLNASLWIEDVWTPKLQRDGDQFLMTQFLQIPRITAAELKRANAVRLFLRVLTIADLADTTGRFIPNDMLTGGWQAGSDLYWPYQPLPPPKFWATFRRCLRLTFCTKTSPHQPAHFSMDLDTPLGQWHPVPRHTWFDVYRTHQHVYWRTDTAIKRMVPTHQPGFYIFESTVPSIPLDAHPIMFTQVGTTIWTHRKYNIAPPEAADPVPPGLTVIDTIRTRPNYLIVGSDASTHVATGISTCAWMIATDNQHIQGCCNITNISSLTSYRGELEGIYRSLLHVITRHITPDQLDLWCDNKAAIDKSSTPIDSLGALIQPEADVILAIQALRTQHPNTQMSFHHVYGHQDTRQRDNIFDDETSPSSLSCSSFDFETMFDTPMDGQEPSPRNTHGTSHLSRAAQINIICDELANDTARQVAVASDDLPPTLQPPYPSSKALLRIGTTWITSKLRQHIDNAAHEQDIKDYCRHKYNWTEQIFDSVAWETIRAARTGRSPTTLMHTSKLMHGWMPVMHRQGFVTGITQCPGCTQKDETFDHMLRCRNRDITTTRTKTLTALDARGKALGIPPLFMTHFVGYVKHALERDEGDVPISDTRMAMAFVVQNCIGPMMLVRGFIATEWERVLVDMGVHTPHRRITRLVRALWDEVVTPIWTARNHLLHNNSNFTKELTNTQLGDRLLWYLQHKDHLSQQDQFLARYSPADIESMTMEIRREWVRHLDTARTAWAAEQQIRMTGQTLLTQYFQPLRRGK